MNNQAEITRCTRICWGLGAVIGLIVMLVLHGPHFGWFWAIVLGLIVFGVVGWLLSTYLCGAGEQGTSATRPAAARSSAQTASTAPAAAASTAPAAVATPAATAAKPAAAKPAPAAKAAKPAAVKAAKPAAAKAAKPAAAKAAKPTAAKAAAPAAAAAPKPAAAKTAKAAKPAAAPKAALAAVDDSAVAAAGAGKAPKGIKAARRGKADDLKRIEGIGPAMEKLCNEMGIFHYDQIAAWGPAEVAWMNGNLKGFKGRVGRDKWVAQARLIGEVGLEAFLERAKTNDY